MVIPITMHGGDPGATTGRVVGIQPGDMDMAATRAPTFMVAGATANASTKAAWANPHTGTMVPAVALHFKHKPVYYRPRAQ
jgi:hypothetical protein